MSAPIRLPSNEYWGRKAGTIHPKDGPTFMSTSHGTYKPRTGNSHNNQHSAYKLLMRALAKNKPATARKRST